MRSRRIYRSEDPGAVIRRSQISLLSRLIPRVFEEPDSWCVKNLDLSRLTGNPGDRFSLDDYPHLRAPLREFDYRGKRKVLTCVGPEQTGKTMLELAGFVWTRRILPSGALIIYPDDGLAKQIDRTKMRPILEADPVLGPQLAKRTTAGSMSYRFSDSITFYLGSGSPITSLSVPLVFCDELDTWLEFEGQESPLTGAKKRTRAYDEALLIEVCTPRGLESESLIWEEFRQSSQGYFHLRCQACGKLTMRSCDVHNLQWELDDDDRLIPESIRLICPECRHEHTEDQKPEMIRSGDYVHRYPDALREHPGYQWGALVSMKKSLDWPTIAEAQLAAGSSGHYKAQLYFYNSIRGLPLRHGGVAGKRETTLRKLCVPTPAKLAQRWIGVDVQADRMYYVVRGLDQTGSTHLLAAGQAETWDALDAVIRRHNVNYGILDSGYRTKEVYSFLKARPYLLAYKGNPHIGTAWKVSEESRRLILANSDRYKVELLDALYERLSRWRKEAQAAERIHRPAPPRKNFVYLPENPDREYLDMLLDIAPNNKVKGGHAYDKWAPASGNDHYFDAEKMLLVFRDYWNEKIFPNLKR